MSSMIRVYFCAVITFLCFTISQGGRVRRIVGGFPVDCGTQPRAISLRNATTNQHLCGGYIVDEEYIVTAAHCVDFDLKQLKVVVANICKEDDEDYPEASIEEAIVNENYDKYSRAHDIAILKVKLQLDDATWLKGSVLPTSSFGLSSDCYVLGYGITNPDSDEVSKTLRAGRVETMSLDECSKRLGPVAPTYDAGMMCALGDNADACQGDSGGPLICRGLLQGISSYGQSCGVEGLPGVYTSIGAHLRWINKVMSEKPSEK